MSVSALVSVGMKRNHMESLRRRMSIFNQVLFGLACLIMLPNSPAKLWWLTPTERALAASRLRPPRSSRPPQIEAPNEVDRKGLPDAMGTAPNTEEAVPERFAWRHIASAFTDPLVLIIAAGGFCDAIALYSVAFFSPTVIKVRVRSSSGPLIEELI